MDFNERRALALRILADVPRLSRSAGSFLGQCVADDTPLTPKQADWLEKLAAKLTAEGGDA